MKRNKKFKKVSQTGIRGKKEFMAEIVMVMQKPVCLLRMDGNDPKKNREKQEGQLFQPCSQSEFLFLIKIDHQQNERENNSRRFGKQREQKKQKGKEGKGMNGEFLRALRVILSFEIIMIGN